MLENYKTVALAGTQKDCQKHVLSAYTFLTSWSSITVLSMGRQKKMLNKKVTCIFSVESESLIKSGPYQSRFQSCFPPPLCHPRNLNGKSTLVPL